MYISKVYIYRVVDWSQIVGFEWDSGNALKNVDKHGISCEEAESVFAQQEILVLKDESHSQAEERWHGFGRSNQDRLLSVTFTVRKNLLRVISARPMNKRERKHYALD
ncbi:MAG: BrnT family toxin [Spartobacteria bacterium]